MNEDYRKLKRELEDMQTLLEGVFNQLDIIAKRMENKAWMSYPNSADVSELYEIHQKLTSKADIILTRMQDLLNELEEIRTSCKNVNR